MSSPRDDATFERLDCIQKKTFVIPGRAALRREGKGIHFVEIEYFLQRMGALPSRLALAGHDNFLSFRCFTLQQAAFSLHAPAIAGNAAIVAQDSVAWNRNRDGIGGASLSNGSHRFGSANSFRDLCVTCR